MLIACWADDPVAQETYILPVEVWPKEREYEEAGRVSDYNAPEYDVYYDSRIGRHGLGFEKRSARAAGLRMPVTADNIQHVGYRLLQSEVLFTPL